MYKCNVSVVWYQCNDNIFLPGDWVKISHLSVFSSEQKQRSTFFNQMLNLSRNTSLGLMKCINSILITTETWQVQWNKSIWYICEVRLKSISVCWLLKLSVRITIVHLYFFMLNFSSLRATQNQGVRPLLHVWNYWKEKVWQFGNVLLHFLFTH